MRKKSKVEHYAKCLQSLINDMKKARTKYIESKRNAWQKYLQKIRLITIVPVIAAMASCSTTKASVKGLAEGTTTTITITTNNPVTTNTTPNVELNGRN